MSSIKHGVYVHTLGEIELHSTYLYLRAKGNRHTFADMVPAHLVQLLCRHRLNKMHDPNDKMALNRQTQKYYIAYVKQFGFIESVKRYELTELTQNFTIGFYS